MPLPTPLVPWAQPATLALVQSVQATTPADLAKPYAPGSAIVIPCGAVLQGPITLKATGTADKPIVLKAAEGCAAAPVIRGSATKYADALTVGSYVDVKGLHFQATNRAGVMIAKGATGVTVEGCEADGVGLGVSINGPGARVLGSYFHDLTMVNNTPRSVNADDDYGANGVLIGAAGAEVAYNRFERNKAPSYDYGQDGGAVELFGTVDGAHIHHNWSEDSVGFLEAGGSAGDRISNVLIEFNVALDLNNVAFFNPHNGGGAFAVSFKSVVVQRNTIVSRHASAKAMGVFYLDGPATADQIAIRDNVVWLNSGDSVFKQLGAYHSGNVFYLQDKATHLYNDWTMTLGSGERFADPGFVDTAKPDLSLKAGSVAAGKGAF